MRKRIEIQRKQRGKVITPANTSPWPHEQRVAKILASAGYTVEFIPKTNAKSADILLNGIEYEVKSPKTAKANSLEHLIKKDYQKYAYGYETRTDY